jgi:hypothetical protein
MTLTERERQFIQALASKIRVLTFEQISGMWWPDSDSGRTNARRRLTELTEHELLSRTRVHARPLLKLKDNTVQMGASHSLLLPWVCSEPRQPGGRDSHATRTMHAPGR